MRIELEETEQRVIEVVLPKRKEDGRIVKKRVIELLLSEIILDDLPGHEKKMEELSQQYAKKEIDVKQYLFGIMDRTLLPSWRKHEKAIGKLTMKQLTALQVGLREATQSEDAEEKKTGRKSA